jgi:hypothetical protein
MSSTQQPAKARNFVRSLNILLKSARLYGLDHGRSGEQFQASWRLLQQMVSGNPQGCMLGVAGRQLVADGTPLGNGPAEQSFAEMLAGAGVASVHFAANASEQDFRRLVTAFVSGSAKSSGLGEQIKKALESGEGTIRANAVRYVAEDSALGNAKLSAQLTAAAMGGGPAQLQEVLNDPQRLLQLIAAAHGAAPSALPTELSAQAAGTAEGAPAATPPVRASAPLGEEDALQILRMVSEMARASKTPSETAPAAALPERLAELPATSQELFQQALASLAASAPATRPDAPMLVQLAEHLAIRFALERFERGEVRVNAVRELLEKSSREIAALRKILTGHEQALARAGVAVESTADVLDRQFWANVPDSGKRAALLSPEAWCIPARNVRPYVEELLERGERDAAVGILLNYVACVGHAEPEARHKAAAGLAEMVGLCARVDARVLESAMRCLGEQLTWEPEGELQDLLANAYAQLAQEAGAKRNYGSIQTALSWLEHATRSKPALAQSLRPRLGVEDRLPEFIEEAVRAPEAPAGLASLLQRSAVPASEHLAARFSNCARREECRRIMELFSCTGAEGVLHLREILRTGPATQAANTVGLLSRFGSAQLERLLISRLPGWHRAHHDQTVRQLAFGDAPERGRLLARLFTLMDHMVLPEALDEIGLCGDGSTANLLLRLAAGEAVQAADPFLRLKAVEALGRLREKRAVPVLREMLSARQIFRWTHPEELRIVSLQALEKIDAEWTRSFLPESGLNRRDLTLKPLDAASDAPWARHRRYARVALAESVSAMATTPRGDVPFETNTLSLGGGVGQANAAVPSGTHGKVQIKSGWRNVSADVIFREAPRQQVGFEIVEIGLEDRARLRRMLAGAA